MTYLVVDGIDKMGDDEKAFMEAIRRDEYNSVGWNEYSLNEDRFYRYEGKKQYWLFATGGIVSIGDSSNDYLYNDMLNNVYNDYLPAYVFYLHLEQICTLIQGKSHTLFSRQQEANLEKSIIHFWLRGVIGLGYGIPILSKHEHVNSIMRDYLCKGIWHLDERITAINQLYWPKMRNILAANDIFISYRRDGGFYLAAFLRKYLEENGKHVFLDLENLTLGKFDEQILEAIPKCDYMLVLLTVDSNGVNTLEKCGDNDDWVRKEIMRAFESHKKKTGKYGKPVIIPVMVDDYVFPEQYPKGVPVEIKDKLPAYHALRCKPDTFSLFCQELLNKLN